VLLRFPLRQFRTNVRRKDLAMITLFALLAAYGGWRAVRGVRATLRDLPRRNDDMVLF
jgi:hypothetical protein